jgi:hypothetical protein
MKQGFPPPLPAEHVSGAIKLVPSAVIEKYPVGLPFPPPPAPTMKKFPLSAP